MQELLLAVARGLVEDKDAVKVTVDAPREACHRQAGPDRKSHSCGDARGCCAGR